jgi:hypothetical protein
MLPVLSLGLLVVSIVFSRGASLPFVAVRASSGTNRVILENRL